MRVAVIGAGLQGTGIALELSLRGVQVDLFEKRSACITQASLHNEGKIHLGFVYANDPTLATARLMMKGAFRFESIVGRWIESGLSRCAISSPFYYVAHRSSLLHADQLTRYYAAVTRMIEEATAGGDTAYFGQDACAPVRRIHGSEASSVANPEFASAVFQTPEVAIDPQPLARLLHERVASDDRIRLFTGTRVTRVTPAAACVSVEIDGAQGRQVEQYDHVVNASWEDLLVIDATAGVIPTGAWTFRVKHFLRLPALPGGPQLPSATIVLGPFGDVVTYGGEDVFLSWYPVGRLGIAHTLKPPPWPMTLDDGTASRVRTGIFEALRAVIPAISCLGPGIATSDVNGGIIYALGNADVDDPTSRLHERHSVGPRSFGRYHTVNTGKYTLAPLFAEQTADRIAGRQ